MDVSTGSQTLAVMGGGYVIQAAGSSDMCRSGWACEDAFGTKMAMRIQRLGSEPRACSGWFRPSQRHHDRVSHAFHDCTLIQSRPIQPLLAALPLVRVLSREAEAAEEAVEVVFRIDCNYTRCTFNTIVRRGRGGGRSHLYKTILIPVALPTLHSSLSVTD